MSTVAEFVGRAVAALGATRAFGVVGSGNFHLTNALRAAGVDFVAARHEGGAVVMADAFSRLGGGIGVVTVHQGCGLTNTATGLGEAAKSRTPLLLLAAAAPAGDPNNNFAMDQEGLARSVGAESVTVDSPETAHVVLAEAFALALSRRAVLVNLPIDVQAATVGSDAAAALAGWEASHAAEGADDADDAGEVGVWGEPAASGIDRPAASAPVAPDAASVEALALAIGAAERPVFICGRGARGASRELRVLAQEAGALLATSAVAKGLFAGDPFELGISGGFATPLAAELIRGADLVVGFGCALNDWTTRRGALLAPDAVIAQVDDTAAALGRHRGLGLAVHGDVALVARELTGRLAFARSGLEGEPGGRYRTPALARAIADEGSWAGAWERSRREGTGEGVPGLDGGELTADGRVDPRSVTAALDALLPEARVVSTDSGNFMGYPAAYLSVPDENGFAFTQAFQSIGLGLGTAIGAALAQPGRLPVLGTGDGGFLMGIAELETAVRLRLPLLVVVYDDAAYGAEVHHFGPAADLGAVTFPESNLAALAVGFGADASVVRSVEDLGAVTRWLGGVRDGRRVPLVLDVKVASDGGAWWLQEAFARH